MSAGSTGAFAEAAGLARWVVIVAIITFTHGCAAGRATVAKERKDAPVDGPRESVFPGVVACDVAESNGSVHVLLGRSTDADGKSFALTYTRSGDAGATWSEPVPIPTGHAPPTRMHRGDDPQVAVFGDHLMALWTARGQGPFGSGPLATALSDDGGRTWRAGPVPRAQALPPGSAPPSKPAPVTAASSSSAHKHDANGTGPGYRFPAAAGGRDGFHVVWIHAAGDERSLRHARLPFGASSFSGATVIDPHICACCWNEVRCEADGSLLALYRDQQPSDMSLAVSRDGGRSWESGRAGQFDWNFDGCPHVGGGVATVVGARDEPRTLLATVWTGNAGATGAYVLQGSPDGKWSSPTPLASDGFPGRDTDIAALPGTRTAAAVWDQFAPEGGGQCVYAIFTADGGRSWSAPRRLSAEGENASFPRVVSAGRAFVALWTSYGKDGATNLRVTRVEAP